MVTPVGVDRVEVVPAEITLVEGERERVAAVLADDGGEPLSIGVTWTVDDPGVASVSSDGIVEALRPGTTLVRASLGEVSGTAELVVVRRPTLKLSPSRVSFEAGPGRMQAQVREIDIENGGGGTLEGLEVRVESGGGGTASWLSAELSATSAPTRLRLRADPAGLAPGMRRAVVTLEASTAEEPAEIDVSLRVEGGGSPNDGGDDDGGGDGDDDDEDDDDDDEDDDDDGDDDDDDEDGDGATGSDCRIVGRTIPGDLHVPANTTCVLHDVYVIGHLRLDAGASVTGTDVTVGRNVDGRRAGRLALTDVRILGDLRFRDGGSTTLADSYVAGRLELRSNVGSIELRDNEIGRDAKIERNRLGPFRLDRNTIGGRLECRDNDPSPSGTGNVAEEMTDQCSGL